MAMSIRVREAKKSETAVPGADGYLVQYKFKNGFKDFRISDCVFTRDLAGVGSLVKSKSDGRFTFILIGVRNGTRGARAQLEKAVKIFQSNPDFTVKYNKSNNECTVYFAWDAKVWPLVDGQELSKAIPVHVTPSGEVLSTQEYKALRNEWGAKLEDLPDVTVWWY